MTKQEKLREAIETIRGVLKFGEAFKLHVSGMIEFFEDVNNPHCKVSIVNEFIDSLYPPPTDEDAKRRPKVKAWNNDKVAPTEGTLVAVVPSNHYSYLVVDKDNSIKFFAHAELVEDDNGMTEAKEDKK